MEYEVRKVYDRFYDDQSKQPNAELLGTFQVIEQIEEDCWSELFIGRNVDTNEICLIRGTEVCYVNSGTVYSIFPLKHLCVKD